jgi:small subunit ribosomal protein S11
LKYPFKKNARFFNLGKRKLEEILARFKDGVNGLLTVHSTKHNTIITLTSPKGDTLGWASAGMFYKKGKRGTPLAASLAAKKIARFAKRKNIKVVGIKFNGLGRGNVAIVNEIKKNKINILYLKDVTPTSHNGCRPPKLRRKKNSHRQAFYE